MTAPSVNAGDTRDVTITITATIAGESDSTDQTVTVKGPDRPQSVTQISGKVKDQDGKAISGASVAMRDSAGTPYQTTTNGSGGYSFNSSDSKPIAPGNISVGALKTGYESATVQIQASAGRSVNVPLTLKLVEATASPSASVSASAEASAAVDDATDGPSAEAPPVDPATKSASDNSGGGSLLFIVLGGLLVAAGVGAIVLVVMRRKNNGDDGLGGPDDPTVMGGGPGMIPPSQGRFNDATRVAAPMGAGRDATMVAPRSGAGSLSDAPTMMHRPVPVDDEFPDPYGAPIPQQGGYRGAPAGGWDDQADGYGNGGSQYGAGNAYGEPAPYGRQQEDDGYGAGGYGTRGNAYAGGQPDQRRYDEPTGMYRPESEPDDGYGYDRGGYGAAGGGAQQYGAAGGGGGGYQTGNYAGAGGYEQQPGGYDRGGYEPEGGAAYGPKSGGAYPGGTYGGSQQQPQQYGGGYDEGRDAYGDQGQGGGYDQRGGAYGRGGGYEPAGHDDQAGYGDQGGRAPRGGHGGQSRQQEPSHPGQRRSLDWMDN